MNIAFGKEAETNRGLLSGEVDQQRANATALSAWTPQVGLLLPVAAMIDRRL